MAPNINWSLTTFLTTQGQGVAVSAGDGADSRQADTAMAVFSP